MATAGRASAQISIAEYNIKSERQERLSEKHWILSGSAELERGTTKVFADTIEFLEDQEKVIARGNVVYSEGASRIAADSAEFSTKTSLGTFFHASGISPLQPQQQRTPTLGISVPQATGLDTDVYFFGEKVEKLGTKKYRITNGGFTTCVQPTPRWDLSADTIVLNIDDYTLLRQMVMKVKGVPIFYLPIMYFPTQEDGRATGFLIPTYGQSQRRGHNITNAFFWAINRSMDATFTHDWFSKTGSGVGAEYRYVAAPGSDGNITAYRLEERGATYQTDNGLVSSQAATSFNLNGSATQIFPGRVYARARVNYFSSIVTNQTFNVDINTASSNTRDYGGNVVGSFGSFSLNGTFDRREYFGNPVTNSAVTGTSPRITLNRSERPLFGNSRVYFGANADYARLERQTRESDVVVDDRGLTKIEFAPQIRYPFSRWQWFTINTSANWRGTAYSRSLDPANGNVIVDEGVARGFFTAGADFVGPVFTRVWNTPSNGYAERFKHTIEPYLNLQRTTGIEGRDRIVQIESNDAIYGNTTRVTYGLNNRFYAKRRLGTVSQAQEILALEISQSYYSNPAQAAVDPRYATSYAGGPPSNFSVIQVNSRVTPTQNVSATVRGEIDQRLFELRTLNANGGINWSRLQANAGWSKTFFVEGVPGFDDPTRLTHYLNFNVNARTVDNRYGVNTSFNYDVLSGTMTQQRMSGFYNTQCCGFAIEYQKYSSVWVLSSDQRFFFSFSLAGLGNFSPMSGGLSGMPR